MASVFHYFAYGSCMNFESLSRSLGTDVRKHFVGRGMLEGYELRFNYLSINEPTCCANLVPHENAITEGALFSLPMELAQLLDAREGVTLGRYDRNLVTTQASGALYDGVVTYTSKHVAPGEWAPSDRYRSLIVQGLNDANTSHRYRLRLMSRMEKLKPRTQ